MGDDLDDLLAEIEGAMEPEKPAETKGKPSLGNFGGASSYSSRSNYGE
jgi:hypothetical protein